MNSLTYEDLGSAAQRERRRRILDAAIALASKGGFEQCRCEPSPSAPTSPWAPSTATSPPRSTCWSPPWRREFEQARETFDRKPIPGETPADRVMYVLGRTTRTLQRDPHLTEALTRAFMFADASVANEIHVVGMHVTRILMAAMRDPQDASWGTEPTEPTEEEIAITKVIGDVWLASLVQWVTGRASANDVAKSMDVAVHLLVR